MAGRVSIECPGCGAKLKLADSSKLGKKIKCPKCTEVFVAKAADDADEDFDEEDAPAKPAANRKRPVAGGKKSRAKKGGSSSGGGSNVPLIAGGAVAVLLLIGAGLYFSGFFGGSKPLPAPPVVNNPPPVAPPAPPPVVPEITPTEKALALRWMPKETETLLHVKVADLWQAPLLKGLLDTPQAAEGIKQMQEMTGISPVDIESITVGFADMQGIQAMGFSAAMGMPVQASPPKALAVVRTKKSMSLDDVLKTGSEHIQPAEYSGKKYFESKKNTEPSGWFADPQTLVVGMPAELKAAMDRGETVTPRKEFSMMEAAPHVILVFAPKDPKSLSQGMEIPPLPGIPPEVLEMQQPLKDSFAAFGLGLSIRGGFDLQTAFAFTDADGAKKVKVGFDKGVSEGRTQFEQFKATAQPLLGELGDLLLNNLKVDEQNQIVKVSTSIPDSAQQKLEQLPPLLMVMAMSGGFGGGGPPGFGPPGGDPAMKPGVVPFTSPGGPPGGPSAVPGAFPPAFAPGGTGDGKKPGETEAVDAEMADGLPEGVTLSVKTSWSDFPVFSADGTTSHPIQIMLDVKGEGISSICGYGQIATKPMSVTEGGVLKMAKSMSFGAPDPAKSIVPFNPEDPLNFDHPEGTLRLTFLVDPPTGAGTAITSLEGTFKYLTSDESEEITIEDAPKTALRPLSDPKLKAAGVKLLYTKATGVSPETLTLSCGKGAFLGKAGASNPSDPNTDGLTMYFNPEVEKNLLVQKLHPFDPSGKFPEKLQVAFKLHRNVKEHTVSFRFENVPLPSKLQTPGRPDPAGTPGSPLNSANSVPGGFNELKMPGETAAVPAVKAEGSSDEFKLTAKTSWENSSIEINNKNILPLRLMVDATGNGLNSVLARGQVTIKTIMTDGGESLSILDDDRLSFGKNSIQKMWPFALSNRPSYEQPANTMRINVSLSSPVGIAKQISTLEGTFTYLTGETVGEFTITNAPKTALKPLTDPKFKVAGVNLSLSKETFAGDDIEVLKLSCNKGFYIGSATITYPDNGSSGGLGLEIEDGRPTLKAYGFEDAISFSGKEKIQFTLYRDVKEQVVSFQFENVPLPSPDAKAKP